jgi:hypothetical protein
MFPAYKISHLGTEEKMDLREIGWAAVYWINLALNKDRWRALVNMVMNFLFP